MLELTAGSSLVFVSLQISAWNVCSNSLRQFPKVRTNKSFSIRETQEPQAFSTQGLPKRHMLDPKDLIWQYLSRGTLWENVLLVYWTFADCTLKVDPLWEGTSDKGVEVEDTTVWLSRLSFHTIVSGACRMCCFPCNTGQLSLLDFFMHSISSSAAHNPTVPPHLILLSVAIVALDHISGLSELEPHVWHSSD